MQKGDIPVVSGLYYCKGSHPEPLVFRGRGNGCYMKWKPGDKVWADGVPTGSLLIHGSILKTLYNESPEYIVPGTTTSTRRVFEIPHKTWWDGKGNFNTLVGTTDLAWCTRIMENDIFKKAGWPEFQRKKYPFLVDTGIFVKHIDRETGEQYPKEVA